MNIISWRLLSSDNYWRERSLIQNLTTAPHRSLTSLFFLKFCIVYSCTTFNKWPLGGSTRSWEGFLLFQHTLHTQHHNKQRPTRASLENQRRTTGELRNSKRSLADGTRSRRWRTWVLSTREELVEAEMFSLKWAQVMKIIQTEAPTNAMNQQRRCASSTTPTPTRTGRVWNVWKVDWVVSFAVLSALICPIQLCFRFERFKFELLHLIHYFISLITVYQWSLDVCWLLQSSIGRCQNAGWDSYLSQLQDRDQQDTVFSQSGCRKGCFRITGPMPTLWKWIFQEYSGKAWEGDMWRTVIQFIISWWYWAFISTLNSRTTMCKFNRIGCQWRGPFHEVQVHESTCIHPHRSGGELMDYLFTIDGTYQDEKKLYATLFDLLSFEKIAFNGTARLICELLMIALFVEPSTIFLVSANRWLSEEEYWEIRCYSPCRLAPLTRRRR